MRKKIVYLFNLKGQKFLVFLTSFKVKLRFYFSLYLQSKIKISSLLFLWHDYHEFLILIHLSIFINFIFVLLQTGKLSFEFLLLITFIDSSTLRYSFLESLTKKNKQMPSNPSHFIQIYNLRTTVIFPHQRASLCRSITFYILICDLTI